MRLRLKTNGVVIELYYGHAGSIRKFAGFRMVQGRIMGLDALPTSSPQSKTREPTYAVVILNGEDIIFKNSSIKRSDVPQLAKSWNVTYLACDNVLEIATKGKEITEFCKTLPEGTQLVQVTGNPLQGKFEKLMRLVKFYNIQLQHSEITGHLEPLAAAEAAARLTRRGIGFKVEPFERECKIIISKGRHTGPGGSSAQRYERRVRGAVRRITREVRVLLRENEIEFDEFNLEGYQGLNKSTFYANISLENAKKILRTINQGDLTKVTIERVAREELGYFPLISETCLKKVGQNIPPLIIGIDPGTTTGLAILNIHGKPLLIHSEREFSTRKIIRQIMKYGKPVLFACDVPSSHKMVEKIANSFDVPVSSAKKAISVSEKNQIAHEFQASYNLSINDTHQRDALVAALKAHNELKNKLEKIETEVTKLDDTLPIDAIKIAVIQGKSLSEAITEVREAIQLQLEKEKKRKDLAVIQVSDSQIRRELESLREKVIDQRHVIEDLEQSQIRLSTENRELQKQVSLLEQSFTNLKRQRSLEVEKERHIRIRDAEIRRLNRQVTAGKIKIARLQRNLANLERMNTIILKGRYIPLKLLKNLSIGAIEETEKSMTLLPGDVVYILDPSGGSHRTAEELCKRRIRAIVAPAPKFSHLALRVFQEAGVPIFIEEDVGAIWIDNFVLISRDLLEKRMACKELVKLTEEQERAEEEPLDLKEVILEYKEERRKLLDQLNKENDSTSLYQEVE